MAAANDIIGLIHYMPNAFSAGYGFDSIALALLGRSHPVGVVLAALLFGTLRAGATRMQSVAQIPVDIISILQAMIIIFIAAPEIIRALYRLRAARGEARRCRCHAQRAWSMRYAERSDHDRSKARA